MLGIAKKNMLAFAGRQAGPSHDMAIKSSHGVVSDDAGRCSTMTGNTWTHQSGTRNDRISPIRLGETEHPSVTGRRPTRPGQARVGKTSYWPAGLQRSPHAGMLDCGAKTPMPFRAASYQWCSHMIVHPAHQPRPRQSRELQARLCPLARPHGRPNIMQFCKAPAPKAPDLDDAISTKHVSSALCRAEAGCRSRAATASAA